MSIEDELKWALEGTIKTAKAHGYNPGIFMQMLAEHGGVETARRLLAVGKPQTGLFELYDRGLLNESMEAVILQPKFRPLFKEDEINEARKRLADLDFTAPWDK